MISLKRCVLLKSKTKIFQNVLMTINQWHSIWDITKTSPLSAGTRRCPSYRAHRKVHSLLPEGYWARISRGPGACVKHALQVTWMCIHNTRTTATAFLTTPLHAWCHFLALMICHFDLFSLAAPSAPSFLWDASTFHTWPQTNILTCKPLLSCGGASLKQHWHLVTKESK